MEGTADPIRIGRAEDAIEVVFIAEELKSNQRLFESECPPSNVESLTKHSSFLSPPLKNVSFFLANATTKMNVSKDRRTPERRAEHSSEHVFCALLLPSSLSFPLSPSSDTFVPDGEEEEEEEQDNDLVIILRPPPQFMG